MVGGAAGHNINFLDLADLLLRETEVLKVDLPLPDAGENAPAQGLGLLHDLLEHEVLIAALLRRVDLPVHVGDLLLNGLHQVVVALDAVLGQHRQLIVVHVPHFPGVLDNGRHVAGQEAASLAIAQNQRTVLTHGDELVRLVGTEDTQRVGAFDPPEYPAHSLQDVHLVRLIKVFNELGHHLRVGLRGKWDPLLHQERLQLRIVLDDAVVHHGDLAAAADLGMGVDVAGGAVGGPAGVADAHRAVQVLATADHVTEHLEAALGLLYLHPLPVLRIDCHAGAVIAPVLQALEPVQQNRSSLLLSYISYDSAHSVNSSCFQVVSGNLGTTHPQTASAVVCKRTNAQRFVALFRLHPFCCAVARVFVGCIRTRKRCGGASAEPSILPSPRHLPPPCQTAGTALALLMGFDP